MSLYTKGDVVWYADHWFNIVGIGMIWCLEEYRPNYVTYVIYDYNNKSSVGEYGNTSYISMNVKDLAPISEYKNACEFILSRGADPNKFKY